MSTKRKTKKRERIECDCGKKFTPKFDWHKRCSRNCRQNAYLARMREKVKAAEIILKGAHGS